MIKITLFHRLTFLCLVFTLALSTSLSAQTVGQGLGKSSTTPPKTKEEIKQEVKEEIEKELKKLPSDPVLLLLETMTIEEKVAQLMFVRINGELAPTTIDTNLIRNIHPGGIIIPKMGNSNTVIDYTQILRRMSSQADTPVPFFIAGDAFQTLDNRTQNATRFMPMPTRLAISAAGSNDDRVKLFEALAENLDRVGINTHFGPSLSLTNTLGLGPSSIYTFGSNPEAIATIARELGEAFNKHNITWVPQDFPGGSSNRSGGAEAVLMTPKSHYIDRDGFPYLASIQADAPLIHVGNTLVPNEKGIMMPASMSKATITTLLKGSLNFKGLIVAGPVNTPNMLKRYSPEKAAYNAIKAGADMILWNSTSAQIPQTVAYICKKVKDGELNPTHIDIAIARILNAKKDAGLFEPTREAQDGESEKIARETRKHPHAYNVERRSITLLKNYNNLLPLIKDQSTPIFLTGVIDLASIKEALETDLKHVRHFEIKSAKHLNQIQDFELRRLTKLAKGCRTAVCIFDNQIDANNQGQIIAELKRKNMKVVVFLLAPPTDITPYQLADALLMGYSDPKLHAPTVSALIDILLGKSPVTLLKDNQTTQVRVGKEMSFNVLDIIQSPTGKLPIKLEPLFLPGFALYYIPQSIKSVEWEFGDNNKDKGHQLSHIYNEPGDYIATVTIKQVDGTELSGKYTIQVNDF
jgi:beta-glucosidase-like glycosyl hydrolase